MAEKFGKDSSQNADPKDKPGSTGGGTGKPDKFGKDRTQTGGVNPKGIGSDKFGKDRTQSGGLSPKGVGSAKFGKNRTQTGGVKTNTNKPQKEPGKPEVTLGDLTARPDSLSATEQSRGPRGAAFSASSTERTRTEDVAEAAKAPPVSEPVVPQVRFGRVGVIPAFLGGLPNSLFDLLDL